MSVKILRQAFDAQFDDAIRAEVADYFHINATIRRDDELKRHPQILADAIRRQHLTALLYLNHRIAADL